MLGFQSPAREIDLAKAVRAADIAAADRSRLRRLARRTADTGAASGTSTSRGLATAPRPVRPVAGSVGAPRRSSG
jgi:hypothetical protein